MIVYLDASALVKLYAGELGSRQTIHFVSLAELAGTSLVSRAEVSAALARAERTGALGGETARQAQQAFSAGWLDFARLPVSEALVQRAQGLAWDCALRGLDAVHLASALMWQESLGAPVTLATFDRRLWEGGKQANLGVWPHRLPR